MSLQHTVETTTGQRFSFGENWSKFIRLLDEYRIQKAEQSLREFLQLPDLEGRRFLDIGSGSGLFSLAARRLGATVHSFDYDPQSVACTQELWKRFFPNDVRWTVEEASVLDADFIKDLGTWDVVYSWGVLHHTGKLYEALNNAAAAVKEGGSLFIAIYNDQGRASRQWLIVKKAYNRLPASLKWVVLWPAFVRLWGPTTVRDLLAGQPFHTWRNYSKGSMRGMSPWSDVVDWVGGLPFEVATPEQIFEFFRERGFALQKLKTCAGGHGCNEFVFKKGQLI